MNEFDDTASDTDYLQDCYDLHDDSHDNGIQYYDRSEFKDETSAIISIGASAESIHYNSRDVDDDDFDDQDSSAVSHDHLPSVKFHTQPSFDTNSISHSTSKVIQLCLTDLDDVILKRRNELAEIQRTSASRLFHKRKYRRTEIGEYLEQSGLQANDNTDSSQESSAPMLSGGYGGSSCSVPHSPSVHKQALQSSPPLVVLQNMNRNIMADDSSQTDQHTLPLPPRHTPSTYSTPSRHTPLDATSTDGNDVRPTLDDKYSLSEYRMDYSSLVHQLKVSEAKNEMLQRKIHEIEHVVEENYSSIHVRSKSLTVERNKLEMQRRMLEDELVSTKEELLFIRAQLQSKSARILDLEAELATSMQHADEKIVRLTSSSDYSPDCSPLRLSTMNQSLIPTTPNTMISRSLERDKVNDEELTSLYCEISTILCDDKTKRVIELQAASNIALQQRVADTQARNEELLSECNSFLSKIVDLEKEKDDLEHDRGVLVSFIDDLQAQMTRVVEPTEAPLNFPISRRSAVMDVGIRIPLALKSDRPRQLATPRNGYFLLMIVVAILLAVIWTMVLALCVLYLLYLEQLYDVPIVYSNDLLDGYRLLQRHATGSDLVDGQLVQLLQYCQDFIVAIGDRLTQTLSDERLLSVFNRVASYSQEAASAAASFGHRASEQLADRFNSIDFTALRAFIVYFTSAVVEYVHNSFDQGVDHIKQYL